MSRSLIGFEPASQPRPSPGFRTLPRFPTPFLLVGTPSWIRRNPFSSSRKLPGARFYPEKSITPSSPARLPSRPPPNQGIFRIQEASSAPWKPLPTEGEGSGASGKPLQPSEAPESLSKHAVFAGYARIPIGQQLADQSV